MRFPFFNNPKTENSEPVKTLTTPPRLAGVNPRSTQPRQSASPVTPPVESELDSQTVPVYLGAILPQLPSQLFVDNPSRPIESVTVPVPVSLILSKVNTGKIDVRLKDLLPHFPADLIRQPLPNFPESQAVVLPLAEVIEALPPELLMVHHESEITADDPELDKLPKLIDDALLEEPPVVAAPEPQPTPVAAETPTAPAPSRPTSVSDVPEHVLVGLASLLAAVPDNVLSRPRAELCRQADAQKPVLIPVAPMLPQLRSGSIRLPLSVVLSLISRPMLANPMPDIEDVQVALPLVEIIPQLPQHLFTDHLRDPQPQDFEAVETDFPDPFHERSAQSGEPQPFSPPVSEALAAEPALSEQALADDTLDIFSEKIAAPAAPLPAEPASVEAEPEPEPVAEVAPSVEAPAPVAAEVSAPVQVPSEPVVESAEPFDEQKYLVNLNRCTVEDLMGIPGVGRALATRIIEFRNAQGQFRSIDDLRTIPGIGRKTFRALTGVQPRALNRLLGATHDSELSLQEIVRLAGQLPGVEGCMLALSDGLFLTGSLPAHLDQETVSVFAPQLFKKVGRYARELKVGQIRRFTIFTDTQPISIFRAGDVYLIVVHDNVHFSKALLRRCERISQELARLCRQRAVV